MPRPVLTDEQHAEVMKLYRQNVNTAALAEMFGVSRKTIYRVVSPGHTSRSKGRLNRVDSMAYTSLAVVIQDEPETLTGLLMGDPSPMRRRLMQEGRI
jgi:hypothetical protein